MYTQDYDETLPYACPDGWWQTTWGYNIQPYVKNIQVLRCPSDSGDTRKFDWAGPRISYVANGMISWRDNANQMIGVMGMAQSWITNNTRSLAGVGRSAETILLAEKHDPENQLWFGPLSMIYSTSVWDGWGNGVIPDGRRDPKAAYPLGPNGAVADKHSGMSNFCFVDGHVKSFKPAATNPDPDKQSDKNLWDAARQ